MDLANKPFGTVSSAQSSKVVVLMSFDRHIGSEKTSMRKKHISVHVVKYTKIPTVHAFVNPRTKNPRPFVDWYGSSSSEGMLNPLNPELPLYIIVAVICLTRVEVGGERSEKEYEKSASRNTTPSCLYNAMSCG
jgi:hypothetical protein